MTEPVAPYTVLTRTPGSFETSVYMIDLRRMVFPRTVLRVLDGAVLNVDLVHGVVGAATDRADRDTVSSRASGTGERDILDESIQISQNVSSM